jgi:hypothetical protein
MTRPRGVPVARRIAMSRILLLPVLLLLVLACATADFPEPAPVGVFDRISIDGATLGWGKIAIGISLARIGEIAGEQTVRRNVESPNCSQTFMDAEHHGRTLSVQVRKTPGGYEAESIFVPFTAGERSMSLEELHRAVTAALPTIEPKEGRHGPVPGPPLLFQLPRNPDLVILVSERSGLYLSRSECID